MSLLLSGVISSGVLPSLSTALRSALAFTYGSLFLHSYYNRWSTTTDEETLTTENDHLRQHRKNVTEPMAFHPPVLTTTVYEKNEFSQSPFADSSWSFTPQKKQVF